MSTSKIDSLRREYAQRALREEEALADPIEQFDVWLKEAIEVDLLDATAMTLSTATADGKPSARIVLLKSFDHDGFVFFGNYESRKGQNLAVNPHACLLFYWRAIERQVRIEGSVSKLSKDDSEAYFKTRPRESQLGAWASEQSQVIDSRQALATRFEDAEKEYDGREVPMPPTWGGYVLKPTLIEFWQGGTYRLHDRLLYTRDGNAWKIQRLAP